MKDAVFHDGCCRPEGGAVLRLLRALLVLALRRVPGGAATLACNRTNVWHVLERNPNRACHARVLAWAVRYATLCHVPHNAVHVCCCMFACTAGVPPAQDRVRAPHWQRPSCTSLQRPTLTVILQFYTMACHWAQLSILMGGGWQNAFWRTEAAAAAKQYLLVQQLAGIK